MAHFEGVLSLKKLNPPKENSISVRGVGTKVQVPIRNSFLKDNGGG